MRAAVLLNYNEPLIIDTSIRKPEPLADDVLVKIKAAGINPADYKFARGDLKMVFGMTFPAILGMDFSGIIEAVGSDVTDFKIGDEVYGNVTPREMTKRGGSYSEYFI
jgi:NADPH:quinone reductase-like Zn-dependent oxidoreductase